MSTRRSSGRLGLSTIGALGSQKLLLALAGVVTARLLGPSDKGLLAVLTLAGVAAALAGACGVDVWAARGEAVTGPMTVVRGVARRQIGLGAGLVVLLTAVLAVTIPLGLLDGVEVLTTGAVGIAGMAFLLVCGVAVRAERWRRWGLGQVLDGALFLGACLVLAVGSVESVAAVLAVAAVGRLGAAAFVGLAVRGPSEETGAHRAALRFGIPAGLGGILLMATYRVDVLVLAWLRSPEEVGLYVTAAAVSEALWLLPDAVTPVVLRRSGPAGELDVAMVTRLVLWSIVVGGAVLVAVGAPLIAVVFGEEYRAASAALPGLWVAAIALGVWKVLVADLATFGETRVRIWSSALAIVAMIAADLVLVPAHGIVGAAWGSAIGYGLAMTCAVITATSVAGRQVHRYLVPRPGDVRALASLWPHRTSSRG